MMKLVRVFLFLSLLALIVPRVASAIDPNPPPTPVMQTVDPGGGKPGDVISVTGKYLGKEHVSEVYLTLGETDLKVTLTEHNDESLKFKIPAEAKPGKYSLTVLTVRTTPNLIEQPVSLRVQ